MELDLNLRARIHCLEKELAAAAATGLVENNAGVRSVMIEYDARHLSLPDLLALIERADAAIGDVAHMVLPSRIVHLPMAFDERWVEGSGGQLLTACCRQLPALLPPVGVSPQNSAAVACTGQHSSSAVLTGHSPVLCVCVPVFPPAGGRLRRFRST